MFVYLDLCLFHSLLSLGLPQVFSERDALHLCVCLHCVLLVTICLVPSSLFVACYLFDWKLDLRNMEKTGVNIHGCGGKIEKVDCGWDSWMS